MFNNSKSGGTQGAEDGNKIRIRKEDIQNNNNCHCCEDEECAWHEEFDHEDNDSL